MSSTSASAADGAGAHDDHDAHDHDEHDHAEHGHDAHDHQDHDEHDHDEHGHDEHGHGDHDHAHDLRGLSRRSLSFAFVLIAGYMVAEIVGGLASGSLALLADAGHMATDAAAIGLALLAMWIAERAASAERTFGFYRIEVLAALLNAIALWLIVAWIFFEAYHRFFTEGTDVDGWPVLFVGLGGLVVNVVAALILHRSSEHSLNAEGAFQHVMADLLGSAGVVISSILILSFGWNLADPIMSIAIGLLILVSSWGLMTKVIHVLLEGTPENIDVYKLCSDIEELEGVTVVHDVHAWTITSQSDAFTAHVLIDATFAGDKDALLIRMKDIAHREFGIEHVTIQMEESVDGCDENHHVDHLAQRSRIAPSKSTWGSLRYLLPGS